MQSVNEKVEFYRIFGEVVIAQQTLKTDIQYPVLISSEIEGRADDALAEFVKNAQQL